MIVGYIFVIQVAIVGRIPTDGNYLTIKIQLADRSIRYPDIQADRRDLSIRYPDTLLAGVIPQINEHDQKERVQADTYKDTQDEKDDRCHSAGFSSSS
jgi:hypothetical protein